MAWELHALLHNAGIQPPYILVGHSIGGFVVRVFTTLYPGEVAGLALIDPSHPQQRERLPRTHVRDYPGGYPAAVAYMWMRPLGVRRLRRDVRLSKATDIPSAKERRGDAREMLAYKAMCGETERLTGNLGKLPLAVLTSARVDPGYTPREQQGRDRFYEVWTVMQAEQAALSTDSVHVVADHGGHHLNHHNPALVTEVITGLVRRVRTAQ
jgi:pimeloyl-ACP methyl ester carboxylesterase